MFDAVLFNLSIFVIQGFFLSIVNLIILATVLFHRVLRNRKEFIIIAALALADALLGLGYVFAGIGRSIVILSDKVGDLRSRWQCFWTPWNQMFLWADISGALMLLVVSVDRLLAVGLPIKYFKFTKRYALTWAGSVFGFTAACAAVATVLAFGNNEKLYPATCSYMFGLDPSYYKFNGNVRIFGGVGSIVVYAMVLVVYNKKQVSVAPKTQLNGQQNSRREMNAQMKIQRKLTKTLGICSAFTLVFYVLPLAVEQAVVGYNLLDDNTLLSTFLYYIYIINNINPTANYFIYTLRHKEIKKAVSFMFKCKQMSLVEFKKGQEVTHYPSKQRVAPMEMSVKEHNNNNGAVATSHH